MSKSYRKRQRNIVKKASGWLMSRCVRKGSRRIIKGFIVYKNLALSLRQKVKKRLPARVKEPLEVPETLHHTWSMGFVTDVLDNKRRFRAFTIIADYNREALHIEVDFSLPSNRVIWLFNHLINRRTKSQKIRMDNGPEFIAKIASEWSQMHGFDFQLTI